MIKWQSNIQWPCKEVSTDKHDTRKSAESVCKALLKEGWNGERKVFPIQTWISLVPVVPSQIGEEK